MTMGSDGVGSSIDASGNVHLLINYYCGKDIFLGTGSGATPGTPSGMGGSKVFTGDIVHMRGTAQIGGTFSNYDPNTGLNIYANNANGIKVNTSINSIKALLIKNSIIAFSPFTVYGNGNAHFGNNLQIGFPNEVIQNSNVAININNSNYDGILFHTYNNSANMIAVSNLLLPNKNAFTVSGEGKTEINTFSTVEAISVYSLTPSNNTYTKNFVVKGSGQTFIGNCAVQGTHANALLQVCGKTATKSLFVLKPETWSDYVFNANYHLNTIIEEEQFIQLNGHLKGIPSEKEVLENGYDVNEMNAKLLAKLEESYLHIIQLQKQIADLQKQLNELKAKR
jgi:hypothetical protein